MFMLNWSMSHLLSYEHAISPLSPHPSVLVHLRCHACTDLLYSVPVSTKSTLARACPGAQVRVCPMTPPRIVSYT